MRRSRIVAALFAVFMLIPMSASAQSAQKFSLQFSGLGSVPFGSGLDLVQPGPGWEAQLRVNPSLWSFGFGVEQTFHSHEVQDDWSVTLLGGFFEPRRVIDIGSNSAAPYLALRVAVSQLTLEDSATEAELTTNGFTVNGGGGVLIRMGGRTNLDLGVTVGYKDLGEVDRSALGLQPLDFGTGQNIVARIGLAIGLGG
jgi:hypothetical protein